ncbi:hypothetical protein GE09DRAFT_201 [Coniochaeta sp. 2T2.1]|nr:hypothetical protein GE09DRAFT_201 [Coniochaeta sp. 2T2.1]
MVSEEKFAMLFGNVTSSSLRYANFIDSFPKGIAASFEGESHCRVLLDNGWVLCRVVRCLACNSGWGLATPLEAATLHTQCLQLFTRNCTCSVSDAVERLWMYMVWRKALAGPKYTSLRLPTTTEALSPHFLELVAKKCGLSEYADLPQELQDMILNHSRDSILYRYAVILESAGRLSKHQSEGLSEEAFEHVLSWSRGERPRIVGPKIAEELPFIRLTIDYQGLKKVERLISLPAFDKQRYDDKVYSTEHHSRLHNSMAVMQFKDGFTRLRTQNITGWHNNQLQIWDMPSPPSELFKLGQNIHPTFSHQRMTTINLDAVTGLTFFIHKDMVMAIHSHTEYAWSAKSTFDRLPDWPGDSRLSTWVYVPLPPGEQLLGFGYQIGPEGGSR